VVPYVQKVGRDRPPPVPMIVARSKYNVELRTLDFVVVWTMSMIVAQ